MKKVRSKWTRIKKMPSRETLERFLDGMYEGREGVKVIFDIKKGEFVE